VCLYAVECSTVPLVDCNFTLLPVHFAVDPAVDNDVSDDSQSSLSVQLDLMEKYMDLERVAVTQSTLPSTDQRQTTTLTTGETQAGQNNTQTDRKKDTQTDKKKDTQTLRKDTQTDRKKDTQTLRKDIQTEADRKKDLQTDKKKDTLRKDTQTEADRKKDTQTDKKKDSTSKRLGLLGRVMPKKLKSSKKQSHLMDTELRQRRKASLGTVTQSTRLSCLTEDMLLDHTQVNTLIFTLLARLITHTLLLSSFCLSRCRSTPNYNYNSPWCTLIYKIKSSSSVLQSQ